MAIDIKFDLLNNPEPPTLILANRNGNKLGQLDVNPESVELIDKFNEASEISFTVNKYVDGKITNLWDKLLDFKLIYCKEWDVWFEATVELDEATESVKTVFCTQLGQAELSQIMLYDIEINTEADIEREDYKIGILYDPLDSQCILSRLLDKAPHYSIFKVDGTLANIQRSFSFDGTSIYDAFQEIAEEIGCLFIFHSDSDENGMPRRLISVKDLQQNCNNEDCKYRGEFTDKCPKCGSTDIKYGYGEDTLIFVTSDELASEGIQLVTDTDSVKNCFKLEAGDDLMTATVRNRNPNGTDYIWYFSKATKEDMPDELVEKLEEYDEKYQYYYNEHKSNLDSGSLNGYNSLVSRYSAYNEDLETISNPIVGFASLMNAYYNTIDFGWYLKSGMMPTVTMGKTNAQEQGWLLETSLPPLIAVTDLDIVSKATADSTVLAMAKAIVKSSYKVTISSSSLSGNKWSGVFNITNYSDEEDTYTTSSVSRSLTDWEEDYIKQKIDKILSKENTDDLSIVGLFDKDYSDFCAELKKYALTPLTSFHDACQSCLDILIEQGTGDKNSWEVNELSKDKLSDEAYKNLAAEQAKIEEWGLSEFGNAFDTSGNSFVQHKFGNVDMDNRFIITWSNELKNRYSDVLLSWNYNPVIGSIDTVFGGSSRFGEDILPTGIEIAFTPILNTNGKATFIHKDTLYNYIEMLVIESTINGVFNENTILNLDKNGRYIDGIFIQNVIAATDESLDYKNNGNWAETVGRLMHFSGRYGAVSLAKVESNVEDNLYKKLYLSYYKKLKAIESEMKTRETEVNIVISLQTNVEKIKVQIQNELNFENYLGKDLWLQFCAYRREDKYSNSNYISDGLNNAELFERALQFYEVAENEIFKSAELQHSISATLNNLLAIPKFRPLVESFDVGNWIRVQVDEYVYKLRLVEYEISYGDFNSISVKFSDVAKTKNGYSDLEDILSDASSMASSYDSIQRQANLGNEARDMIRQWLNEGLDASLVQIQNNTNEDIVIDNNGLLGRSYSDITEEYSDEQIRLTHNIMAFTDDNWESVRQAIGKHKYKYFDEGKDEFTDAIGYGVSADFMMAGVIGGSQIIGGNIYSDNYSPSGGNGSYINLRKGDFSFGGGALRFEIDETTNKGKLIISSDPTSTNVTELNDEWLKTTSVYAQNLQVNSAKITGKLTANQIDASELKVNAANIIGELTIGQQLPDNIATTDDIPDSLSQLKNDVGYQNESGVTKIVGGVVTTDYVEALGISVEAARITGTLSANQINMTGAITWDDFSSNVTDALEERFSTVEDDVKDANDTASAAEELAKAIANGEYSGGTLINGTMIYSPTIYGGEIYWGDDKTLGGLLRTTGLAPDSSGAIYETNLVHLWTSDGMYLEAQGGGMRLWANSGLWLDFFPEDIHVNYNGNWMALDEYVGEHAGGSSVAVFG